MALLKRGRQSLICSQRRRRGLTKEMVSRAAGSRLVEVPAANRPVLDRVQVARERIDLNLTKRCRLTLDRFVFLLPLQSVAVKRG